MKKIRFALIFAVVMSLVAISTAIAQTEQLVLKMSRDWGYGGFNGDIQGLFSMRVTGPEDLAKVEFYIDKTKIGEVTQPPFNLQFNTDNYPLGIHQLYVLGHSTKGQDYRSNTISANFVPKQSSTKVILPVLGVILVAILLSTLVPFLASRGKRTNIPLGAERNYGAGGGGICPNCHRPFALPLFSAHLGFSKLAPCPFCGKWSLIRIESIEKLRDAEKAELVSAKAEKSPETSDEEKLRKEIDDSRFQGF